MRPLLALATALVLAPSAFAQRAEPLAFHSASVKADVRIDSSAAITQPPPYAFPARLALGVGAAVVGGFGGIFAGLAFPHARCSCDDPGLENAVVGFAVGSVISSAVIAALPQFESKCGTGRRIGTAILSSTAGAVLGGFAGSGVAGGGGILLGYVGGRGVGSALGAALCKR